MLTLQIAALSFYEAERVRDTPIQSPSYAGKLNMNAAGTRLFHWLFLPQNVRYVTTDDGPVNVTSVIDSVSHGAICWTHAGIGMAIGMVLGGMLVLFAMWACQKNRADALSPTSPRSSRAYVAPTVPALQELNDSLLPQTSSDVPSMRGSDASSALHDVLGSLRRGLEALEVERVNIAESIAESVAGSMAEVERLSVTGSMSESLVESVAHNEREREPEAENLAVFKSPFRS